MIALVWGGCGGEPVTSSVVVYPTAPLSAELTVHTGQPTALVVDVTGPGFSFRVIDSGFTTHHVVPIHGTRADVTVELNITATDRRGAVARGATSFDTGPLPDDLPHIEGGGTGQWLLMPLTYAGQAATVVVDTADGEVAWVYAGEFEFDILEPTEHGTLVGMAERSVIEIDWFGRVVRRWALSGHEIEGTEGPLDATGLHHDVQIYGEVLAVLSHRTVTVDAYPTSVDDPTDLDGPTDLEDSVLSVFRTSDGSEVGQFGMSDRLDTERILWFGLQNDEYGKDWAHANALLPWKDGWLVSVRHQVALVHLGPTGDLRWILGDPHGWGEAWQPYLLTGLSPLDYAYAHHGPSIDETGDILVFDNHNYGYTPYEERPPTAVERSRVIAWSVDEESGRAAVAWEWTPPDDLFSRAMGNAKALAGPGVIGNFPYLAEEGGVPNAELGRGDRSVRVFGFDPGDATPWLDLSIWTDRASAPEGVDLYRALPVDLRAR